MDEQIEELKVISLSLCNKLINDIESNEEDTYSFFGGDLLRTYIQANETALDEAKKLRNKIRYL